MDKNLPIISVIITTYNAQATLKRLLVSILNQNGNHLLFKLQIIVVDDCSTDETPQIVKSITEVEFLSTDKNSGGPNKGRNMALDLVKGNYICVVDHDDEWLPNKVESFLPHLEKADIISSGFFVINSRTQSKTSRVSKPIHHHNYIFYDKNVTFIDKLRRTFKGQVSYLGSLIYNAKLKHIRFEEQHGKIDYDWGLKLFHESTSLEICQELYIRYVDGENLSLNEEYRILECEFNMMVLTEYLKLYPREAKEGIKKTNGSMGKYYYLKGDMKKARHYFLLSFFNFKTALYYFTSYIGSSFIRKHFNIFG
jgi:glycosyltransferase involved in cell wall biosynthesis